MEKVFKKLLEDLSRANVSNKKKMAEKFGFTTVVEFKQYLDSGLNPKIATKKPAAIKVEENPLVDMVVAFDTTGSMSSYIASVRKHVEKLIGDMFTNTPGLRMKIVAFGDYCDMKSKGDFGRAYQTTDLTDNQNDLIRFVKEAQNTSGGDGDEFYELVIKKVVEETAWREGSKRVFLLIGDDVPHSVGYSYSDIVINSQIDYKVEAKSALKRGIQIDTLRIHPKRQWYQEVSTITGGVCMNFKNADRIGDIVEAATYLRGSKVEFMNKFKTASTRGEEDLVGAMKTMYMSSASTFDAEEKATLDSIAEEGKSKSKKK